MGPLVRCGLATAQVFEHKRRPISGYGARLTARTTAQCSGCARRLGILGIDAGLVVAPASRLGGVAVAVPVSVAVPVAVAAPPVIDSTAPTTRPPTACKRSTAPRSWSLVVLPWRTTSSAPSAMPARMAASVTGSSGGASTMMTSKWLRSSSKMSCHRVGLQQLGRVGRVGAAGDDREAAVRAPGLDRLGDRQPADQGGGESDARPRAGGTPPPWAGAGRPPAGTPAGRPGPA